MTTEEERASWEQWAAQRPEWPEAKWITAMLAEADALQAENARLREQLAAYTGITETVEFSPEPWADHAIRSLPILKPPTK